GRVTTRWHERPHQLARHGVVQGQGLVWHLRRRSCTDSTGHNDSRAADDYAGAIRGKSDVLVPSVGRNTALPDLAGDGVVDGELAVPILSSVAGPDQVSTDGGHPTPVRRHGSGHSLVIGCRPFKIRWLEFLSDLPRRPVADHDGL